MAQIGIAFNVKRLAVSQLSGIEANGCANVGGVWHVANADGISAMNQDTDNGLRINASVEFHRTDFGQACQKRVRTMQIGGEFAGTMIAQFCFDQTDGGSLEIVPKKDNQSGMKRMGQRSEKGRYVQLKIRNKNGCDFRIDSIDLMLEMLSSLG